MKRIITSLAVLFTFVCILSTLAHTKAAFADLKDCLVAYYPFNGNANDESGNGNNGTVNGATLTTDRFGNTNKAYSFDGVNDYIDIGNNTNLKRYNTSFTVSSWIKLFSYSNSYLSSIISNRDGGYYNSQSDAGSVFNIGGKLSASYKKAALGIYGGSTAQGVSGGTLLILDTWYYIAAVFNYSGTNSN